MRHAHPSLMTKWGERIDAAHLFDEYPRPQMRRAAWLNLNGRWNYGISNFSNDCPIDGEIIVPFAPESILSGVSRQLQPQQCLLYQREVIIPGGFPRGALYLHFGAVDQEAEVFINDRAVGRHVGGFTPFCFDIAPHVEGDRFQLKVRVKDYSDKYHHQIGKQRLKPGGIFYTAQSGIWQTVWLEGVPKFHIKTLKITPIYDEQAFRFDVMTSAPGPLSVAITHKGVSVGSAVSEKRSIVVPLTQRHDWTPDHPELYDFTIKFADDEIAGYGALRKFERKIDANGGSRFYLNGTPYLMIGILDQGYWSDGLLTAPSDDALRYDVEVMKRLGFNTIRKHIKLEPLRWYYHCDIIGMLVWQDMPNGGEARSIIANGALALAGINLPDSFHRWFGRLSQLSRRQYIKELEEMLHHLQNVPSLAVWTPFNEAWGQFDSLAIVKTMRQIDATRLIDHASGWSDQGGGDFHSRHIYFTKIRLFSIFAHKRIKAVTEFGGFALKVLGHVYDADKQFGYKKMATSDELMNSLTKLWRLELIPAIEKGLGALIYTQVSDVEEEINGLLTYDRRVVKVIPETIAELNQELREIFTKTIG